MGLAAEGREAGCQGSPPTCPAVPGARHYVGRPSVWGDSAPAQGQLRNQKLKTKARRWKRAAAETLRGVPQSEAAHTRARPRPPGESDEGLLCLCFNNRTDAFTVGRAALPLPRRRALLQLRRTGPALWWRLWLRSLGSGAQPPWLRCKGLVAQGYVDFPSSGIEPASPALAGGIFIPEPRGRPSAMRFRLL